MTVQDDDFNARIKRVRAKSGHFAVAPQQRTRRARDTGFDEHALRWAILLPQLALLLGAAALIAGRAIAMNYFDVVASTEVLGRGEGALVIGFLLGFGLLFGRSQLISHCALIVGASLAFLGESYYIPAAPDLMGFIYSTDYVARVILGVP